VGKGAKIAIGCGIAVIVLAVGVMIAVFGAAWWAKCKVEELAGDTAHVQSKSSRRLPMASSTRIGSRRSLRSVSACTRSTRSTRT